MQQTCVWGESERVSTQRSRAAQTMLSAAQCVVPTKLQLPCEAQAQNRASRAAGSALGVCSRCAERARQSIKPSSGLQGSFVLSK
jgi:hypothetical protein